MNIKEILFIVALSALGGAMLGVGLNKINETEYTYTSVVQASINGCDCAYEIWRAELDGDIADEDTWEVVYRFDDCDYGTVEVYTKDDIYFVEDTHLYTESGKIDTILPTEADVWLFIADKIIEEN